MKRLILLLRITAGGILLSIPALAQSNYTWALVCKGAAGNGSAGTGVTWAWLHDGAQISLTTPPNGFASCATPPLDGIGEIPNSIDGVEVNGIAVFLSLSESPAGCNAFASVTKSFDPSDPKVSINASVSAPSKSQFNVNGSAAKCPSASFHFSLTN